jgi:5S rRNA maturation endonuclease (ribonuclease M5)
MEAVEHHVEGGKRDVSKIREVFDEDELKQLGEDLESAKGTAHRKAG